MKVISFIERRQRNVIKRILQHCGLWQDYVTRTAHEEGARSPPLQVGLLGEGGVAEPDHLSLGEYFPDFHPPDDCDVID